MLPLELPAPRPPRDYPLGHPRQWFRRRVGLISGGMSSGHLPASRLPPAIAWARMPAVDALACGQPVLRRYGFRVSDLWPMAVKGGLAPKDAHGNGRGGKAGRCEHWKRADLRAIWHGSRRTGIGIGAFKLASPHAVTGPWAAARMSSTVRWQKLSDLGQLQLKGERVCDASPRQPVASGLAVP
jgi:hypothetical protein